MMRLKKAIRNLLVLAVLVFLFMKFNGLYFSPVQALHASERDLHFGPSEIVHSFDYDNSRIFLTRYENLISCPPIDRFLGVFWRYGAGHGIGNDPERPLFFSYRSQEDNWLVYGIRNDPSITHVEVEVRSSADGDAMILSSDEFYEDMFYVMWKVENEDHLAIDLISYVTAYDAMDNVVYETEF